MFPGYDGGIAALYRRWRHDAFVAELTPAGTLAAATYLGGSDLENSLGLAANTDGSAVLAGTTRSRDFPVTASSPSSPPGYFVSKLDISDLKNTGLPCLTLAIENAASFETGPIAPGELVVPSWLTTAPCEDPGVKWKNPDTNSPSNPAKAGTIVSIYGTGGGVTNPGSVTGGIAQLDPLDRLALPYSIQIDGVNAEGSYAGVTPR